MEASLMQMCAEIKTLISLNAIRQRGAHMARVPGTSHAGNLICSSAQREGKARRESAGAGGSAPAERAAADAICK